LYLATRDKREDPPQYKPKFWDLEFGRGQLKYWRLWKSMTEDEQYAYINHNPERFRLEHFVKLLRTSND
jgi:hypothetical protein